jgi:subtilase family serine protease
MAACLLVAGNLGAQSVSPRIRSEISLSQTTPLKGSLHPLAQPAHDAGRVPADTKLNSVSILFNRSAAQQADLDALIAAQQNPSSPQYHKWLTPEQFGKRFGMAQADLDKITTWLEQQGFSIDMVARSRTFVRFSGTVRQVEAAFSTQMHYYKVDGVQHFAPSTELSVPAAAAATIQTVHNLDDFRPKSQAVRPHRNFTSSQTGNVYFAPGDIVTAYDVTPLVTSNITGSGQSIAVIGQSAVLASDIENFQNAAGLTVKDPTMVLMPGTGSSATFSGDETESDLDLEWSGALAPGANIYFVYTGSDTNVGAFDSLQYAIDSKIGDIITVSYGSCEPLLNGFSLETSFQEAATQGQSVIAASGDSGSTACFSTSNPGTGDPTLAQQEQVAVNYPASSPYVTGIGGTEITSANDAVGAYWGPATNSSTDNINSLLQYIPEVAWNDDSPNCGTDDCLSASGGGASALFPKPSWQTGVTGIPTANNRYVPDISLYASPNLPGYLLCTSDSSAWATNQQASCNSGFRDSATGALTVEGGTSFATPIFAGMLALLNQKNGYTSGQGLINPSLYTLASSSGTYASAFHDVTTGNNDCTGGSADCSSSTNGFNAGTGYDEVTGLGSIDLNALAGAWPSSTSTLIGTTTTVTAANSAPQVNVSDTFTITVSSDTGSTVPSGNVTLIVDGGTPITGNALSSNGTVTYAATFTSAGMHQIVAQYLGDSTHAPSTGVGSVTIAGTSSGKGTIALSSTPSTLTVTQGSSGVETITVTPAGGYTGTVYLTFVTSNDTALTNLCYDFPNITTSGQGPVTIGSTAAVSTQLTLDTLPSDCGAAQPHKGGAQTRHRLGSAMVARNGGGTPKQNSPNKVPAYAALAGLLLVGFMGRYARKFTALAGMVALLAVGLAVTACGSGGGGGTTVTPDPPKGTYTVTVTGTDSVTSTITGTTTFTFVIQ